MAHPIEMLPIALSFTLGNSLAVANVSFAENSFSWDFDGLAVSADEQQPNVVAF